VLIETFFILTFADFRNKKINKKTGKKMSDDDSDDDYDNAHQIRGASNAKQAASNQ
jgi:hypothetical protein